MKKYSPPSEKQEKEPLYISQGVLDRFRLELKKHNNDFDELCSTFRAVRMRSHVDQKMRTIESICRFDDPVGYQKMLERHGLADLDLFYNFIYPINYFRVLQTRTKS